MNKIKGIIKQLILEGVEDDYKRKLLNDNSYLNMQMINHYVNEFNKIKNNLPSDSRDITKYDWKNLESVVDSNQSLDKIERGLIEIDNSDVIYNQNNLKILKANTKNACVKYGTGYGFCISSRGAGNQYYNYRYGNYNDTREKSIYFVIDEDKTKDIKKPSPLEFVDPTHMLVIMVTKQMNYKEVGNGKFIRREGYTLFYQVTTANNDGDDNMTWEEIVKLQPKLNGLQKLFQPLKPNTKEHLIHITRKEFNENIKEWRDENKWLGKSNYNDLELYFGDDASIKFYTNDVETLEFNYKLIKKIKDLSVNGQLQVFNFVDTNYINHLTFITPLFSQVTNKYDLKSDVLEYLNSLNIKGELQVDDNSPIIKKDCIIVDGYVGDSNIFKLYLSQYARFQYKFNITREEWVVLDRDFYRYANEIEKLYKLYMNDINYTISNAN